MKECGLCHKLIDTKKERYVHVEDWNAEKMMKDLWIHLICFNKGMNRELTDLEKQAKEMLGKAGNIFKMLPVPDRGEYET